MLHEHTQVQHRGKTQQHKKHTASDSFSATGPNQVWSWDITYCSSKMRGQYFLHLIENIFSRKIVGREAYDEDIGDLAAEFLQRTVLKEQCFQRPMALHSDNGAPMKSVTLKTKMEELGISGLHSRPLASNDNPFSEALFKTLKTCPM